MPIGGDMGIRAQDFQQVGSEDAWPSFGKRFQLRCDTGRSALKLALLDFRLRCGPTADCQVWVPSYICPTVSSAVAQLGLTARVYPERPGGAPWRNAPQPAPGDFVIVVHYFGLLNQPAIEWLDSYSRRNWTVLEDCVQAPYTDGAGERGDYAITSLRKWWPAADGAVLSAAAELSVPALLPPNEAFISRRTAAKLLRAVHAGEMTSLGWVCESEELLERDAPREPSWMSTRLLNASDAEGARNTRRANWSELSRGLGRHARVEPVFERLNRTETPLAYPILVRESERDPLRRFLQELQIYCAVHWPLGRDASSLDLDLSRRMLSLPLDQRYGTIQMQYVVSCINDFYRVAAT